MESKNIRIFIIFIILFIVSSCSKPVYVNVLSEASTEQNTVQTTTLSQNRLLIEDVTGRELGIGNKSNSVREERLLEIPIDYVGQDNWELVGSSSNNNKTFIKNEMQRLNRFVIETTIRDFGTITSDNIRFTLKTDKGKALIELSKDLVVEVTETPIRYDLLIMNDEIFTPKVYEKTSETNIAFIDVEYRKPKEFIKEAVFISEQKAKIKNLEYMNVFEKGNEIEIPRDSVRLGFNIVSDEETKVCLELSKNLEIELSSNNKEKFYYIDVDGINEGAKIYTEDKEKYIVKFNSFLDVSIGNLFIVRSLIDITNEYKTDIYSLPDTYKKAETMKINKAEDDYINKFKQKPDYIKREPMGDLKDEWLIVKLTDFKSHLKSTEDAVMLPIHGHDGTIRVKAKSITGNDTVIEFFNNDRQFIYYTVQVGKEPKEFTFNIYYDKFLYYKCRSLNNEQSEIEILSLETNHALQNIETEYKKVEISSENLTGKNVPYNNTGKLNYNDIRSSTEVYKFNGSDYTSNYLSTYYTNKLADTNKLIPLFLIETVNPVYDKITFTIDSTIIGLPIIIRGDDINNDYIGYIETTNKKQEVSFITSGNSKVRIYTYNPEELPDTKQQNLVISDIYLYTSIYDAGDLQQTLTGD